MTKITPCSLMSLTKKQTKRDGSKEHDHIVLNFAGPLGSSTVRRVMTLVGGAKMIP